MNYDNDADYENKLLKKLLEQETSLKAKIQNARRQDEKRKVQIQDNRNRIIGAAIAKEMEMNEVLKKSLQPFIDKHTTNAKDRKSLGLSPLPKTEKLEKKTGDKEIQSKILTSPNDKAPQTGGLFSSNQ